MFKRCTCIILVACGLFAPFSLAEVASSAKQPIPAPQAVKPKATPQPASETGTLINQLRNPDPAKQQDAIDRLKAIMAQPQEVNDDGRPKRPSVRVESRWLGWVLQGKHYDDVEVFAVYGIVNNPGDSLNVSAFQKSRTQAFLAAGRYDQALSAAKAYYNVSTMRDTEGAIDLLCVCLMNARPNDKGIARKFKAQQVALATTQPAEAVPAAEENILKSITVDAKPFEDTLKQITVSDYSNLIAKGNLLLLSDQTKEAKACFMAAGDLAFSEKQLSAVTECIARAIRAEAGAIGPANSFILSKQAK